MTLVEMAPTSDVAANNTVSTVTSRAHNVTSDVETESLGGDTSRR